MLISPPMDLCRNADAADPLAYRGGCERERWQQSRVIVPIVPKQPASGDGIRARPSRAAGRAIAPRLCRGPGACQLHAGEDRDPLAYEMKSAIENEATADLCTRFDHCPRRATCVHGVELRRPIDCLSGHR
jgi:hypothetical protein